MIRRLIDALVSVRWLWNLCGLLLFVLAGCWDDTKSSKPGQSELVLRSNYAALPPGPYQKIVSLTPNMTEMVAAVGAGDKLVGRTQFCDYPEAILPVPVISSGVEPEIEALLIAAPDLVVVQKGVDARLPVEALNRAGIQIYVSKVETGDDVIRTLKELGVLTGHAATGIAEAERVAAGLAGKEGESPSGPRSLRILIVHGRRPLIAAGPHSWGDELIRLAGYRNALDQGAQSYPTLDAEWVVKLAPDVIIDTSFAEEEGSPEGYWRFLGSGESRPKLIFWSESEVLRPGPRVVTAVEMLRKRVEL